MSFARAFRHLSLLAVAAVPFICPLLAHAQIDDSNNGAPPTPGLTEGMSLTLSYLVMFVLLVIVVVVSLYPSKRSHQE